MAFVRSLICVIELSQQHEVGGWGFGVFGGGGEISRTQNLYAERKPKV